MSNDLYFRYNISRERKREKERERERERREYHIMISEEESILVSSSPY
jgi:hypothetical protein